MNLSPQEVLVFTLKSQAFALPILAVQEVRIYEKPMPMPQSQAWFKGILNLRGEIVPVIDMAALLQLGSFEKTGTSTIIVTMFNGKTFGFAIDEVNNVLAYNEEDLRQVPSQTNPNSATTGLISSESRTIQLLSLPYLVNSLITPQKIEASGELAAAV